MLNRFVIAVGAFGLILLTILAAFGSAQGHSKSYAKKGGRKH